MWVMKATPWLLGMKKHTGQFCGAVSFLGWLSLWPFQGLSQLSVTSKDRGIERLRIESPGKQLLSFFKFNQFEESQDFIMMFFHCDNVDPNFMGVHESLGT